MLRTWSSCFSIQNNSNVCKVSLKDVGSPICIRSPEEGEACRGSVYRGWAAGGPSYRAQ